MKKAFLLALVVMASACFTTADAKKKKTKTIVAPASTYVEEAIPLTSSRDTLSYAAGYASTDGLLKYLMNQYQVDTAYIADFVEGFKMSLGNTQDPKLRAQHVGGTIADLFEQRILPTTVETFAGTPDSINAQIFAQAFVAAVLGDTSVLNMEEATEITRSKSESTKAEKDAAYRVHNLQWLVNNGQQEGVVTTESGLQYKVITAGTGEVPTADAKVTVKYEGKMIDGTVFDSSYQRNPQTSTFRCNQVIKGWTEALTMMPVGSKWELYIPQELGYGSRQAGKIKPYSTLIFTVELISIEK
ncbi:MAG: FKBP-type peptidyl-prolyl cis-trans isomerase [Prevotella sp.]|nr:FKBP-type peptidyl-prolyl cis-trans isomerase [Prevotella sp.]